MFILEFTDRGKADRNELRDNPAHLRIWKQVRKCLGLLQENTRHPSLNTHPYQSLEYVFPSGEKVFEAYAQNHTPGAYRIFFIYGSKMTPPTPGRVITILAITPHP